MKSITNEGYKAKVTEKFVEANMEGKLNLSYKSA